VFAAFLTFIFYFYIIIKTLTPFNPHFRQNFNEKQKQQNKTTPKGTSAI
jgi:hypothetical protein